MKKARRAALGGSRGGRGYRYQDAASAALCVDALCNSRPWTVTPEAGDDATIETPLGTWQVQIKSRQRHRGSIPVIDLADWLAELDEKHDGTATLGIVAEREVLNVGVTGFDSRLATPSADALRDQLKKRHNYSPQQIDDLLSRSFLVVLPVPIQSASKALASARDLPEKLAEVAVRQVQARVGHLSDQQSSPDAPPIIGLAATDVAAIIDATLEVIDLEALEEPARQGLCEHVDFSVPIADEGFYLGVDVVPGHVAQGLVFQRPDDVDLVIDRLNSHRLAVITGQSGAGKSALTWLAVSSSRNIIKWVRVRTLATSTDVARLIRFAESLRATPHSPVGFVVDNISGELADVWDVLAAEIRFRPELFLLGSIREENLSTLTNAPISSRVRTRMDSKLARQIFDGLKADNRLTAGAWKESFVQSRGLLLEYVHLLTTGERLPSIISQQIDERRTKNRDLELSVLRIVSLGAITGGVVATDRLTGELDVSEEELQRALVRLLDEHLIREVEPGSLGGLHDVRSRAILDASHHVPPPTVGQTARRVLRCVDQHDLVDVVGRLIQAGYLDEAEAIEELKQRLVESPVPKLLGISLNALRQFSVLKRASEFLRIIQEKDVAPANQELAVQLAAIEAHELDYLLPDIRAAVGEMVTVEVEDAREALAEQLPSDKLLAAVNGVHSISEATELLEALEGVQHSELVDAARALATQVVEIDLPSLSKFLLAARAVSRDLARFFVEAVGGQDEILHRARTELPWIQTLNLGEDEATARVEAEWLFIGSASQDNPHEIVVNQCHTLAGLFPDAEIVSVTAIDPSGNPAGIGDVLIAQKNIPRKNLKSPQDIRWHRALIGSFNEVSGTPARTERLREEASLAKRSLQIAKDLSLRWIAELGVGTEQIDDIENIDRLALQIAKQHHIPEDPLETAKDVPDVGDVASACRVLVGNALPRLYTDESWGLAALLHETVRDSFQKVIGIDYWDFLDLNLDDEVTELRTISEDLHSVLCRKLSDKPLTRKFDQARKSGGAQALKKAAAVAVTEGKDILQERARRATEAIASVGWEAEVDLLPARKPSGVSWPALDVWVGVHLESLFHYLESAERLMHPLEEAFEATRHVIVVPIREGRLLGPLAMHGRRIQNLVLPADRPAEGWPSILGLEWADLRLHHLLEQLVDGSLRYACLEKLIETRALVGEEDAALAEAEADIERAAKQLLSRANDDTSGFLGEVLEPIASLIQESDFAERMARQLRGEDDVTQGLLATVRLALMEWDLDAEAAPELLNEFLDRLEADNGAHSDSRDDSSES